MKWDNRFVHYFVWGAIAWLSVAAIAIFFLLPLVELTQWIAFR